MLQELFNFLDSFKIPEDTYQRDKIEELKDYFKSFFQKYPSKNLNKLSEISDKEILMPLIILNNPLKTKKILRILAKYPEIFKEDKYTDLIALLIYYFNDKEVYNVINDCNSNNPFICIPASYKLSRIMAALNLSSKSADILTLLKRKPSAQKDLRIVFKGFVKDIHNIGIELMNAIDRYQIKCLFDIEKDIYDSLPRDMKRVAKSELLEKNKREKEILANAAHRYFSYINNMLNEITNEYNKSEKERKRNNKNIDELKRILDTSEEIKNIDDILRLCPNEKIKEAVVDYIIKHNKKIYEELIKEYEKNRQNSDENLSILFVKYGFNYELLDSKEKQILKELSYDKIEELLLRLKNLSTFKVNISKVSMFKLTTIEELISKGIINIEWLNANLDLFYEDNTELEMVVTNIDMISKEGLNIIQYSNSLDITRSPLLKHNFYLLRLYSLAITKSTTNLSFLSAPDLRKRIEFIYSLGIIWNLNDLDILNYSIPELIRFKIANSLNISIEDIDDSSEELLCDFAPSIIPPEVNAKLNEHSNFVTSIPEFLESYRVDNQSLNINGVYVSSEKVKRNLAKIGNNDASSCLYAIIHNGFYTYEEIESLRSILIPTKDLFNLVRS